MDLQKLIVIAVVGGVGFWFYKSYETEIDQKLASAQDAEVDPFIRAEGLFHTFKYDQAVEAYRVALGRGQGEPRRQEAYFRIAVSLDKSNRKPEALAAYREAVRLYPNTSDAERAKAVMERLRLETGQ